MDFHGLGINGKISELQAAMGLSVLPHMHKIISSRKNAVEYYLKNLNDQKLVFMKIRENTQWNYSYFPVLFKSEEALLKVQSNLNSEQIFPRRYFYPSLNTIKYVNGLKMEVSEDISKRILCLPLNHELSEVALNNITGIINAAL